nr:reverse transcriptase domain-containing protein [Tanacetum cinerariifolium]
MSSDNAQSAVTYTSISSDSDRPSWGIPLMNAGEFSEMEPYEEVAKQGHPLHPEYHALSDDDIQVEDDDKDPKEDPSKEHEPKDDDEDPEEDPNEEHEPEDSDETEPFEEDETAITPPSPRHRGARISTPRSQYDFVDTVEAGQGLIRSSAHDAWTIARAADIAEDVGYVRDLQASKHRMMTSIEEVNLRVSYQAQVRRQEKLQEVHKAYLSSEARNRALLVRLETLKTHMSRMESAEDLGVTQMMRIHTLEARARIDTVEDAGSSCHEAVYAMTWGTLKKKMTDKYCPKAYTRRFQELALMCTKFLVDETEKVDKYISGLPDNIHRNVMSARPKTLDETIELVNDLMDQKLHTYAERQNDNNRKTDDSSRNSQQQQSHKKQNVSRAYTLALVTRSGNGVTQGRSYVLGGRDASPDSNVITGTFLLNNRYAKILFDTGADRSFVSTAFSASINITSTTLENHFDVELADGKIIGVNTIIRGCTLNFMHYPFNIDLMPIPLGSFDIIIRMDWLTKYHGVIICDEKIVRVPFGREM